MRQKRLDLESNYASSKKKLHARSPTLISDNSSPLLPNNLTVGEYKQVTSDMLKQLCLIKKILQSTQYEPLSDSDRINFQFKKPGFKKLLIFDLDETLIHVKRTFEPNEVED
jgi:hypothetical protein